MTFGRLMVTWGTVLFLICFLCSFIGFGLDLMSRERAVAEMKAYVDLHLPAVQLGSSAFDRVEWFPLYRHETHYPLLFDKDGIPFEQVGDIVIVQSLFGHNVTIRMNGAYERLPFVLPEADQREREETEAWEVIEQIPRTATIYMTVSTRHFVSVEALLDMLQHYRIDLLWIPLYGGESAEELSTHPVFGLTPHVSESGSYLLADTREKFLQKIDTLIDGSLWRKDRLIWKHRMNVIEDHGWRTYGVYVRGTPQELLRLKEVLELTAPTIVYIDWPIGR